MQCSILSLSGLESGLQTLVVVKTAIKTQQETQKLECDIKRKTKSEDLRFKYSARSNSKIASKT